MTEQEELQMLRALVERQKQELKDKEWIIEERDAKIRKQNIQIDNMIRTPCFEALMDYANLKSQQQ